MARTQRRTTAVARTWRLAGALLGGAGVAALVPGPVPGLGPRARPAADLAFAQGVSRAYQDVGAAVAPGVVRIASYDTRGGLPVPRSQGSGIVFRPDGVIVTNAHVVAGADVLEVGFLDGRVERAEVVGSDEESDVAVLRVPLTGLAPLRLRIEPEPRVGEAVLAVGNPLGLGHTVTAGIVSGLGRSVGVATYEDFLQTDAAIHPGNSGGPLVDLEGRVVGINTAVADATRGGQGIGFAIPARMVQEIAEELEQHGVVTRGYLGVQLARVDAGGAVRRVGPVLERGDFVGVESVYRGSPAERAGLRAGDVLLSFGARPVESVAGMLALVARERPGARIDLRVRRGDEELLLPVELGTRPPRGVVR